MNMKAVSSVVKSLKGMFTSTVLPTLSNVTDKALVKTDAVVKKYKPLVKQVPKQVVSVTKSVVSDLKSEVTKTSKSIVKNVKETYNEVSTDVKAKSAKKRIGSKAVVNMFDPTIKNVVSSKPVSKVVSTKVKEVNKKKLILDSARVIKEKNPTVSKKVLVDTVVNSLDVKGISVDRSYVSKLVK